MISNVGEWRVELPPGDYFVADSAAVVAAVALGNNVSVWFSAVVRGDFDRITIGDDSNIQDGAVLHTADNAPLFIGRGVSIGHNAVLQGCTVGDFTLVGMGAVILDHATVGKHCIIGASALIPEGKVIPDRSLVMGVPGCIRRQVTDEEVAKLEANAATYVRMFRRYKAQFPGRQPFPDGPSSTDGSSATGC